MFFNQVKGSLVLFASEIKSKLARIKNNGRNENSLDSTLEILKNLFKQANI